MAKIIKCPKCGENVEIPPNAAGTVVKCAGCGAGLRIKARTQPPAGGEADRSHGSMSGSLSGTVSGSMSGTVIGQTGYGQPAPQEPDADGPPSLGSECAVCGRSVDPDELIEDRGRLVCSRCAKRPAHRPGAAGAVAMDGPQLAPEPQYARARHGPMISIDAAFLTGCAALLIAGAAEAYLYLNEKPVGTLVAARTTPGPATKPTIPTVVSWEEQNGEKIVHMIEDARELVGTDVHAAIAKYDEVFSFIGDRMILGESLKARVEAARANRGKLAESLAMRPVGPGSSTDSTGQPPTVQPPPQEVATSPEPEPADPEPQGEVVVDPPKPQNIFELPPDTPELLEPAMRAIAEKRYKDAVKAVSQLKVPTEPGRDQRLTLEVMLAAYLGARDSTNMDRVANRTSGAYSVSDAPLTRSFVLNRAMAHLLLRRNAHTIARDLYTFLRDYSGEPDPVAHAVLGTAVSRIDARDAKVKAERDEMINFLTSYAHRLDANPPQPGLRRWGAVWVLADELREVEARRPEFDKQLKEKELEVDKANKYWHSASLLSREVQRERREVYERELEELEELKKQLAPYEAPWLKDENLEPVMPAIPQDEAPAPPVPAPVAPQRPAPPVPAEAAEPTEPLPLPPRPQPVQ